MKTQVAVVDPLIERLCNAVRLGEVNAIAEQIKNDLESFIPAEGLILPEKFHRAKPDSYARRLLYQDRELGFTALVMTWGPGQRTALHDHAGIWCVEGVLEGEMEVIRYELMEEKEGVCCFENRGSVHATAGSAGALIPPYEHHVLANSLPDRPSLTLHVYGGEMTHCDVFEPLGEGDARLFRRCSRKLVYDE
ncbi:MAG TPA: cysteine dioxygenase family protein [Thermoanaerobaculia bacterium]|jgi:predicted metal-dependent enzyme (double-stranded beta helix superfamily)